MNGIQAIVEAAVNKAIEPLKNLFKGISPEAHAQVQEQLTAANAKVVTLEGTIAAKDKEITDLKAAAGEKDKAHTAALEAKEKEVKSRVGAETSQVVASLGIPPITEQASTETPTGSAAPSLMQQFNAISDPDKRAEFYQKHGKELLK